MLIVTVLAAVAAVAALVLQVRARRPELTVQTGSAEELTGKHVSGLVVTSSYKGKLVDRLWKIGITITNTGDKTLIGAGPQTNLVHDQITFSYPEWATVLSADPGHKDLDAKVSYTGNKIAVAFDQWRSKEQLQLSLDVAAPENEPDMPILVSESRAIVDGDIIVRGIVTTATKPKQLLIDSLPSAASIPTRILGIGSCLLWAAVMLMVAGKLGSDFFRLGMWRRKFGDTYGDFLAKEFAADEPSRKRYLAKPSLLPEEKWTNFSGKPFKIVTIAETPKASFSGFVVCLVIGLASLFFIISTLIKV